MSEKIEISQESADEQVNGAEEHAQTAVEIAKQLPLKYETASHLFNLGQDLMHMAEDLITENEKIPEGLNPIRKWLDDHEDFLEWSDFYHYAIHGPNDPPE